MSDPKPCPRCLGCGQLADSDDREPWSMWESLPPGSDLAVRLGFVHPEACPDCDGTGQTQDPPAKEHQHMNLNDAINALDGALPANPDAGIDAVAVPVEAIEAVTAALAEKSGDAPEAAA